MTLAHIKHIKHERTLQGKEIAELVVSNSL